MNTTAATSSTTPGARSATMRRAEWPSEERMAAFFASEGQSAAEVAKNLTKYSNEKSKLQASAKEWESYFVSMLMKEMSKTVQKDPMFHGGQGEDMFADMLADESAKNIVKGTQGFGIASILEDSFVNQMYGGLLQHDIKLEAQNRLKGVQSPKVSLMDLGIEFDRESHAYKASVQKAADPKLVSAVDADISSTAVASLIAPSVKTEARDGKDRKRGLTPQQEADIKMNELRQGMNRAFATNAYAQTAGMK